MQPVPYLTRSSLFPAIEAALDLAGADFNELKVYLGRAAMTATKPS